MLFFLSLIFSNALAYSSFECGLFRRMLDKLWILGKTLHHFDLLLNVQPIHIKIVRFSQASLHIALMLLVCVEWFHALLHCFPDFGVVEWWLVLQLVTILTQQRHKLLGDRVSVAGIVGDYLVFLLLRQLLFQLFVKVVEVASVFLLIFWLCDWLLCRLLNFSHFGLLHLGWVSKLDVLIHFILEHRRVAVRTPCE